MRFYKIVLLFCIIGISTNNTFGIYRFADIADSLKKNANAVVRHDFAEFTINSTKDASFKYKYAITILNQNADNQAFLSVYYDKLKKVSGVSANIYDKEGELIKKIKEKDFTDQSISPNGTMFSDNRIKYYKVLQSNYPYTVEFEYTLNYTGIIHFPRWMPIDDYKTSVQSSECLIRTRVDQGVTFRYKTVNYSKEPEITNEKDYTVQKWKLENLMAIEDEPYNPIFSEIVPVVYFAPTAFFYDGYFGNQESWESLGRWAYQLMIGRDQLSEKTKTEIQNLIASITDVKEKTKILYEYMQSKTRYISIQLGIGGFQPFPAMDVDASGYGDCKALSNYMVAILKEANIGSHYAIINAGKNNKDLYTDFSSVNQMNHAIVCVPIGNDTIWLECTSQRNPFGYLGSFTDERYALLIKPEGSQLVKTKSYTQAENLQKRKAINKLMDNGGMVARINTLYRALQYESIDDQLYRGKDDQKKSLYENLDIKNFEIENFDYQNRKDIIPEAIEDVSLNVNNYATLSGERMFVPLNFLNKQTYIPRKINNRVTDVVLTYAYMDSDTIIYELPDKYTVEHIPEPITISSKFGEYKSEVKMEENKLIYIRNISRKKERYQANVYNELIDFYKQIVKADGQKAILIKKG